MARNYAPPPNTNATARALSAVGRLRPGGGFREGRPQHFNGSHDNETYNDRSCHDGRNYIRICRFTCRVNGRNTAKTDLPPDGYTGNMFHSMGKIQSRFWPFRLCSHPLSL